jgi:hypothetical protein
MLRVQRTVFPASHSRFSSMTRATLLQLLAHPTALTGADVRALEQLAEAFPYCQSAHLLLAKAAHDQGSMLAGQRLRRAATYAADRSRLRQLIELAAPAEVDALAAPVSTQADNQAILLLPEVSPAAEGTTGNDAAQWPSFLTEEPVSPPQEEATIEHPLPAAEQPVSFLEDKPDQVIGQPETPAINEEPPVVAKAATPEPELEEEELPAQAPPIRPPVEAAVAHFEFGLAPEEPAEIIAYRLPELEEPLVLPTEPDAPTTPHLPAFSGLADIGYAPEEGSRLGFCLVTTGLADALPAARLPPAGEFFAPDAGLLAHLAAHQPSAPKAKSLDLINSFLQRAPAPSRRRVAPLPSAPEPDAQADLSVRSTRAEPDLASESLAKILARQGKTERAIAVYERLMVKQPEKMAYFAAQIESLRPSA